MITKLHAIAYIIGLLAVFSPAPTSAQWQAVPIGELTDSMRRNPKPAFVLISTDWCAYCRVQRAQLKKIQPAPDEPQPVYFAELDAESRETIDFNDTTYRFTPTGVSTGSHELAHALGSINNRLAFPTWVVLNEKFETIFQYPGVLRADDLSAWVEAVRRP